MGQNDRNNGNSCQHHELRVMIPTKLLERVEAYAKETGSTMESVLIEALDIFLRANANR